MLFEKVNGEATVVTLGFARLDLLLTT